MNGFAYNLFAAAMGLTQPLGCLALAAGFLLFVLFEFKWSIAAFAAGAFLVWGIY